MAFVGLENAGKTSIVYRIINGHVSNVYPTFGINYETLNFKDIKLIFNDLSGRPEYIQHWGSIIKKSDLVVYVIDGLNLNNIKENRKTLKYCISLIPSSTPLLILINKTEEPRALKKNEIIDLYSILELTKKFHDWEILEVSALTGVGIPNVMQWIYTKLTGKKLEIDITLSEIFVFREDGSLIFNKSSLFSTPSEASLTAGFISAVNKFAKQTINEKLTNILIGKYKLIFDYYSGLIGVIIVGKSDSSEKALKLLKQVLIKVKNHDQHSSASELSKEISKELINAIYSF